MGQNSKIEWTDHTFNPWRGCRKVSPGCEHCYAETLSHRNPAVLGVWGRGKPRVRASDDMWRHPLKWNRNADRQRVMDLHSVPAGVPYHFPRPRVFCASLSDWLDDEVPIEWLADLLHLINQTPNLCWMLLTKRPENWRPRLKAVISWFDSGPIDGIRHRTRPGLMVSLMNWLGDMGGPSSWRLPNVWIGTSVEDQTRADERIPELLKIPARVRFLSCEPLLGPVSLAGWLHGQSSAPVPDDGSQEGFCALHWVIVGGESGPGARPMNPEWPRALRDQCVAAGVPFLFKQWGEWAPHRPTPGGDAYMRRVGKRLAGRVLDGQEWNQFPEPISV